MTDGEAAIRAELAAYLAGERSEQEFFSWFFGYTWNSHRWVVGSVRDVINGIGLLYDEYLHDAWTKNDLKEKLRPFVEAS